MQNKEEYYIDRFKSVISNTGKFGFLFLFTLTYVWIRSIQPNFFKLESLHTEFNKRQYFVELTTSWNKKYHTKLNSLYAGKHKQLKKIRKDKKSSKGDTSIISSIYKQDAIFKILATQKKHEYIKAIFPIKSKIDISIKDSIARLSAKLIKIDIPTLNSVDFEFGIAIPIWMCLSTFFILFMYIKRTEAFMYLSKSMQLHTLKKTVVTELHHLDANIPYWLYPFKIKSSFYNKKHIDYILLNYNVSFKTTLTFFCIILIIGTQLCTSLLVHDLNDIIHNLLSDYPTFVTYYSPKSSIICFIMTVISLIVAIAWLFPTVLIFDESIADNDQMALIHRKQFIKYTALTVSAIVTGSLISLNPLHLFLPKTDGTTPNYARINSKRRKKRNPKTHLRGFYINKKAWHATIHYFNQQGQSPNLKSIPLKEIKKFLSNLRPINIYDYMASVKSGNIKFPYAMYSFENSAELLFKQGKTNEALILLQTSAEFNLLSDNYIRAIGCFRNQLNSNKDKLTITEKEQFAAILAKLSMRKNESRKFETLSIIKNI